MSLEILLLLTLSILEVSPIPNYYWRRFHGQIPFDAVVAAHLKRRTTYIGRGAFQRDDLWLGSIEKFNYNNIATVPDSSESSYNEIVFTEILCSPLPHNSFKWVRVTSDTVSNQKGLVDGGFDSINELKKEARYIRKFDRQIGKRIKPEGNSSFEVLIYEDRNEPSDKMCQLHSRNTLSPDYYWRKYNGEVPCDAVVATPDDKPPIYIGRAPFERKGLLVGPIVKGDRYVTVTHSSEINDRQVHHVDEFVEILCSPTPNRFSWVRTTAENLLKQSGLVEGGFHHVHYLFGDVGVLYIGRTLDSVPKVGKVVGYYKTQEDWEDAEEWNRIYYHADHNEKEFVAKSYEVLMYS